MATTITPPGTPRENLRSLKILSIALMIGVSVFAVIAVLINQLSGAALEKEIANYLDILRGITFILAIGCFVAARQLYNKRVKIIDEQDSLQDKLNQYRSALIIYLALCEGASLFSITAFFMTGDYILLIVPAVMILAMLTKIPSVRKIVQLLSLNWNEQQELE